MHASWQLTGTDSLWLRCAVSDTGIGIAPERLERMFDAFQQADSSTSRRFGGTGLGLSIARTFAEKMGGELIAESHEGQGSVFTFEIPLTLREHSLGEPKSRTLPSGQRSHLPVLLVEDNPVNQMVIEGMLNTADINVTVAASGEEALRHLTSPATGYAAVLMDIQLPDIDGMEVCRRYHAHCAEHNQQPIPCIALTASAFELDRRDSAAAGMQDFLSKPVTRQALLQVLEPWLHQSNH